MSGTSMDGIDIAAIRTDGESRAEPLATAAVPHDEAMRALLRAAMREARNLADRRHRPGVLAEAEVAVTEAHLRALAPFLDGLASCGLKADVIGFHGQTVLHRPEAGLSVQIGDGAALARRTGIPVVWDMRARDVAHGGQGAPLIPAWHGVLARGLDVSPVAFVNIGGVANVTWVGQGGRLVAFDCGPGNALMDDIALRMAGRSCDEGGRLAASGRVSEDVLRGYLASAFFRAPPPKSLDRDAFSLSPVENLPLRDALATLAELTARAIAAAAHWFPEPVQLWIVCGGGRRNHHLMERLAANVEAPVAPAEALGLDGDMMEAQGWACLAVRALKGLPITFPETTGAPEPLTGGILSRP